jgi:hypothetical protein
MEEDYYLEENLDTQRSIVDESGYKLTICSYKIGAPEDHYWNFTRGLVYDKDDNLIFDIKRNYSHFLYLFVKHPNGNDYLLCSRDYHGGYSVLDLTNKKEYTYEPKEKNVAHWCWIAPDFNAEEKKLYVSGCYWGAPFEIVTFDFSDPTNLPLPEIERQWEYDDDEYDEDNGESLNEDSEEQ